MHLFCFNGLLRDQRWVTPAYVGIDDVGRILYLDDQPPHTGDPIENISGFVLPGFRNSHSHAFQYAMAGMAERHLQGSTDDFWTWRDAMYRTALSMDPDEMEAVAGMVYVEMLRHGYTHVAEFHYLHHDRNGKPYSNLPEMGERLIAAASTAGIKITLIPIFYQKGDFGQPPLDQQRRFISKTTDEYLKLLVETSHMTRHYADARLGFGVHSLRAVDHVDVVNTFVKGPHGLPFHLHAAEQLKEVDRCVKHLGLRPVQWLLENLPVDQRFHIVHCTHMNESEISGLAKTRASVILCPGTEGNLGDGIFKLTDFISKGGNYAIGTDSHISLNPLEDLRWLDYSQRLLTHKRNTFDDGASSLVKSVWRAGNTSMGLQPAKDFFDIGDTLDCVVFDTTAPLFSRGVLDHLLSSIIYTSDPSSIMGTIVNGKWVVRNGKHFRHTTVYAQYVKAIKSIR